MKKKIVKIIGFLMLTATLWAASAQPVKAMGFWETIWKVWFNPPYEWTHSPAR